MQHKKKKAKPSPDKLLSTASTFTPTLTLGILPSPMAQASAGEDKACDGYASESTKPKRQKKDQEDEVWDPLFVVGPEILEKILNYLDARSVARSLLVSHGWHTVATSDRLWAPRIWSAIHASTHAEAELQFHGIPSQGCGNSCHELSELWAAKAHIPRCSLVRGLSRLTAYSLSVMDGKRDELLH